MSRIAHATSYNGQPATLVWGYDRPLSEFFVQLYAEPQDPDDEDCIFSVAEKNTLLPHPDYPDKLHWTPGELFSLILQHGVDISPNEFYRERMEASADPNSPTMQFLNMLKNLNA